MTIHTNSCSVDCCWKDNIATEGCLSDKVVAKGLPTKLSGETVGQKSVPVTKRSIHHVASD